MIIWTSRDSDDIKLFTGNEQIEKDNQIVSCCSRGCHEPPINITFETFIEMGIRICANYFYCNNYFCYYIHHNESVNDFKWRLKCIYDRMYEKKDDKFEHFVRLSLLKREIDDIFCVTEDIEFLYWRATCYTTETDDINHFINIVEDKDGGMYFGDPILITIFSQNNKTYLCKAYIDDSGVEKKAMVTDCINKISENPNYKWIIKNIFIHALFDNNSNFTKFYKNNNMYEPNLNKLIADFI